MKLKKVLSLGLALAMAASLAACGSGNPAPSDTSGAAGGGQTEKAADAAGGALLCVSKRMLRLRAVPRP